MFTEPQLEEIEDTIKFYNGAKQFFKKENSPSFVLLENNRTMDLRIKKHV